MPGDKTINIGCGSKPMVGAINVDIYKGEGIDVVCDVRHGLPFETDSIDKANADYFLEQILENEKFRFVMNEIWRVLKPEGLFEFKVPNAKYPTAFKDPFDCRYFTKETFDYFDSENRRYSYYKGYGFKPWKIESLKTICGPNNKIRDRFSVVLRKV
jgi:ubiquinone/menaquinone biosynthesis C-methylase UbiE